MNFVNHLMTLLQDARVMPIVQRLGWMLVHSLWQGAALAVLLRIFLAATRWRSGLRWSNIRYAGSCAALALLLACAAATFVSSGPNTPTLVRHGQAPAPSLALMGTTSSPAISISPLPPHRFDWQSFIPLLVLAWMAGVLALSIRYFIAWLRVRQLQRGESLHHPLWTQAQQPLADRLGIRRVVRLVGSSSIGVPVVIGALKPVIVIPLAIVNCLSPQQVQAILAHELAHVRRHDYLLNLLQTALETLFFYHPAVWWMSAQIRNERENCCDDLAAAACGDRLSYASTLVALEEQRGGSPRMALAATDGSLLQRIRRLLPAPSPRRPSVRANRAALVALICLAMLIAGEYLVRTHAHVAMAAPPDSSKPQPSADLKAVSVIVGKNGFISIDGAVGNWQTLRDSLGKLPESSRKKIYVALSAERQDLSVGEFFEQQAKAQSLAKDLGLAYVSIAGVKPPGATTEQAGDGTPIGEVYIAGDDVRAGVYSISGRRVTVKQTIIAAGGPVNKEGLWINLIRRTNGARAQPMKDVPLASLMNGQSPDLYLEPYDEVIISSKPPATQAAMQAQALAKEVAPAIAAQLDRRLPEIKFAGNGFSNVIDFLRDVTGANIVVNWHALEAAGVTKDAPVNIQAKDIKFSAVLQLILDDVGTKAKLSYVIDEGVIRISTVDDLHEALAYRNLENMFNAIGSRVDELKLTDEQKTKIEALCDKAIRECEAIQEDAAIKKQEPFLKLMQRLEVLKQDVKNELSDEQKKLFDKAMPAGRSDASKPQPQAVQTQLDRRLPEINFQGNGFADVIDFLRDVTGANIFVNWHVLEAAGIAKDAPVNIQAKDIKFSTVLQLILDDVGGGAGKLSYVIDDGVIRISTADDNNKSVTKKNGPATQAGQN